MMGAAAMGVVVDPFIIGVIRVRQRERERKKERKSSRSRFSLLGS